MAGWFPAGAADPVRYGASSARASISHGPDGERIVAEISEHLDFLSRAAADLGVPDPVRERFTDAVGQWGELHEAAELWRKAAERLETASAGVGDRLGGIDASWQGADADAFLGHMRQVALAGNEIGDSMRALAEALDHTAESVRSLVQDMAAVIADSADAVSEALTVPVDGDRRARAHLAELDHPAREFSESIEDALRAFVQLCEAFQGGEKLDAVNLDNAAPTGVSVAGAGAAATTPTAAATTPTAAGGEAPHAAEPPAEPPAPSGTAMLGAAGGGAVGGAMVGGMMPMGMMSGLGRGRSGQRQNTSRLKSNPEELFSTQETGAPPVLGDETRDKSRDATRDTNRDANKDAKE